MLQNQVNSKQAFGLVGSFYDDSPRRVAPYTIKTNPDAQGSALAVGGAYTTTSATPTVAIIGGEGIFAGILVSPHEMVAQTLAPSMAVVSGTIGQLCTMGHVVVKAENAVNVGYVAAYNNTTGEIAGYANTGAIPETHTAIPNGKFVFVNAALGETAVLELG